MAANAAGVADDRASRGGISANAGQAFWESATGRSPLTRAKSGRRSLAAVLREATYLKEDRLAREAYKAGGPRATYGERVRRQTQRSRPPGAYRCLKPPLRAGKRGPLPPPPSGMVMAWNGWAGAWFQPVLTKGKTGGDQVAQAEQISFWSGSPRILFSTDSPVAAASAEAQGLAEPKAVRVHLHGVKKHRVDPNSPVWPTRVAPSSCGLMAIGYVPPAAYEGVATNRTRGHCGRLAFWDLRDAFKPGGAAIGRIGVDGGDGTVFLAARCHFEWHEDSAKAKMPPNVTGLAMQFGEETLVVHVQTDDKRTRTWTLVPRAASRHWSATNDSTLTLVS